MIFTQYRSRAAMASPISTLLLAWLMTALLSLGSPVYSAGSESAESMDQAVKVKNPDPMERWNRKVYKFNSKVDRAILKPLAVRYVKHVPEKVRRGVRNFVANLREPTTVINDLLQGKFKQAGKDTARFLVNTTAGLLGIFDVAKHMKLPRNREDFGQTLGKWGVPAGPYMMLPLMGPSTLRDSVGLIPQYMYTDLTAGIEDDTLLWSIFAARTIDLRSELLSVDRMLESQVDPYVFLRESFLQRRANEIRDGEPDEDEDVDALLDEILESDGG